MLQKGPQRIELAHYPPGEFAGIVWVVFVQRETEKQMPVERVPLAQVWRRLGKVGQFP